MACTYVVHTKILTQIHNLKIKYLNNKKLNDTYWSINDSTK